MPFSAATRKSSAAAARSRVTPIPSSRHRSQHVDGVAQAGGGGLADLGRRLALARFVARRTQQRQAEPKRTLRTSRARGAAIQLLRLPQIAQRRRAEGQDVSEHRLRLGRAALGRQPPPNAAPRRNRARPLHSEKRETRRNRRIHLVPYPLRVERGERELRVGVPALRRPLQPAHGLGAALRNCLAVEIAAAHPVLRLHGAATRGARQVTKPLGALSALIKIEARAHPRARGKWCGQTIENRHLSLRPHDESAPAHGSRIPSRPIGSTRANR